MIRVLVMIAVAGFVLSRGDALRRRRHRRPGGPRPRRLDLGRQPQLGLHDRHWDGDDRWSWPTTTAAMPATAARRPPARWPGAAATRLDIESPADVRYTQAAGPATARRSPVRSALVDDVEIENGHIRFDHGRHRRPRRQADHRDDRAQHQPLRHLRPQQPGDRGLPAGAACSIDLSGNAEVTAAGEADELEPRHLRLGEADLGKLKAKGAEVDISGSGDATIAPTDWAKLDISGSGDVTPAHPARRSWRPTSPAPAASASRRATPPPSPLAVALAYSLPVAIAVSQGREAPDGVRARATCARAPGRALSSGPRPGRTSARRRCCSSAGRWASGRRRRRGPGGPGTGRSGTRCAARRS